MSGDIVRWLESLGLGRYAETFSRNDIDLEVVAELSDDDLKDLGLTLGHRRKLLKAVAALPAEQELPPASVASHSKAEAERRQLTVMFADLVGSTALSQRIDPEDLSELIGGYQKAVAGEVARLKGHVARYMGDGVLAYFGYPHAHEDSAERAVHAGLAIVKAVGGLKSGDRESLRVRIGVATGPVVVGDIIGEGAAEEEAVTGKTPNLAARLQGMAGPGQVVIDAMTRRLIGAAFDLQDLGPQKLKGFFEPVTAWSVVGEGAMETRFEATHADTLTRFIGREHELGLLHERWELAKGGEGQIVLLSGEAGIGKSRILQALRDKIASEPHFRLRYQCSPRHGNSAFYPIIQRLERAARFSSTDGPESKLDKLESLLRMSAENIEVVAPLFAALLSLPATARYGALNLTPQQRRDRTIEAMTGQVLALSRQRPVLFVLEDAHWIDPSTETFIGEMMARVADAAVFMVISHRPVYASPWIRHPHLLAITLNRLSRKQSIEIVRAAGGHALADTVIDQIITRADGVPLYVEELIKSVIEVGKSIDDPGAKDRIPATLQALLIARLDQLGEAKETAQVGSVFGREFSFGLLTAVADSPADEIKVNLERLVQSELVFKRGAVPDAKYTFKHALFQDTAYETLLLRRRRQLHARIAEILERDFPEIMATEPETLAHHFSRAGNADKAVRYLTLFADKTAAVYAHTEAVAVLDQALAEAERLRDPKKDQILLNLALRRAESLHFLGRRQEIVDFLLRHRDRLEQLREPSLAGQYYFWLGFAHAWLGHRDEAARSLRRSLEEATRAGDEAVMGRVHRALATECVYSGRPLAEAVAHGREAAALLTRTNDSFWLSQALFTLGYCCIFTGEFDSALEATTRLEALGNATGIRRAQSNAAMIAGLSHAMRGAAETGIALCERALELSPDEFETAFVLACLGRACQEAGDLARAVTVLEQAVALADRVRSLQFCAWFRAMLGEAYLLNGEIDKAAGAVGKALDVSSDIQFLVGVGLSKHLLGRIASAEGKLPEAKRHLSKALRTFATLGARFEEGRIHLDLAVLAHSQGNPEAAENSLRQAHDLFTALRIPKYLEQTQRYGGEFGVSVAL
ncbi:MAG TPA: adenylate/guanylate cyclase domain-containing protein [Rhodospirillales bacterium]